MLIEEYVQVFNVLWVSMVILKFYFNFFVFLITSKQFMMIPIVLHLKNTREMQPKFEKATSDNWIVAINHFSKIYSVYCFKQNLI